MRRLVVSADDFGLTKSVNEGIVRAFREGIVTNINMIPAGEAFRDAARLAREMGLDEAGAHLALTEVPPVSDPDRIPTIVYSDGRFHRHYGTLFLDLLSKRVDPGQVYAELKAQLLRAVNTGIRITSLSSHEHVHMMPALLGVFVKLALEHNITFIRCLHKENMIPPRTVWKSVKNLAAASLANNAERALKAAGLRHTDHFMGLLDSGNLGEEALLKLIGSVREGSTELVTHPGFVGPEVVDKYRFHLNCEEELYALTGKRVRRALENRGIRLVKYSGAGGI